ncbi:hypothetical protein V8D89_008311 [Ganoderma adspersum]
MKVWFNVDSSVPDDVGNTRRSASGIARLAIAKATIGRANHGLRSRPQAGCNQNQGMKGGEPSVLSESVYVGIEFHVQANYDEKIDCIGSIADTIGGREEQYRKYRTAALYELRNAFKASLVLGSDAGCSRAMKNLPGGSWKDVPSVESAKGRAEDVIDPFVSPRGLWFHPKDDWRPVEALDEWTNWRISQEGGIGQSLWGDVGREDGSGWVRRLRRRVGLGIGRGVHSEVTRHGWPGCGRIERGSRVQGEGGRRERSATQVARRGTVAKGELQRGNGVDRESTEDGRRSSLGAAQISGVGRGMEEKERTKRVLRSLKAEFEEREPTECGRRGGEEIVISLCDRPLLVLRLME